MRFYIFANDKDGAFTNSVNDAIMSDSDYTIVRERFDTINTEFKYRNTYLVADLNVTEMKQGMFVRPAALNKNTIVADDYLPFFIIGEFHYGNDGNKFESMYFDDDGKFNPSKAIRNDSVFIKINGFTQQFDNNHSAIMSYINFVLNSYSAKMYIKIEVKLGSRRERVKLDRLLGISNDTKREIDNISFTKIELPKSVSEYYYPGVFPLRSAPKFFNMKDDKEDLGIIHTSIEAPIQSFSL
jgi:hypothetical protein